MSKINWPNLFIVVALVVAALGVVLPPAAAPSPTGVGTQAFQCAPSAMCVTSGGKIVTFPSGSTLTIDSGASFSNSATQTGADINLSGNIVASNATITNVLTAAGASATYLTGTLGTAAQPNVTSLGTLPLATITNLTSTNVTGTLQTANQSNVTNLGTQTYLTATNLTVGASAVTGMSVISASVTNGALVAHGLSGIPKVVCTPILGDGISDTVSVSATNTTSFTVQLFNAGLNAYSGNTLNVNCWAFR